MSEDVKSDGTERPEGRFVVNLVGGGLVMVEGALDYGRWGTIYIGPSRFPAGTVASIEPVSGRSDGSVECGGEQAADGAAETPATATPGAVVDVLGQALGWVTAQDADLSSEDNTVGNRLRRAALDRLRSAHAHAVSMLHAADLLSGAPATQETREALSATLAADFWWDEAAQFNSSRAGSLSGLGGEAVRQAVHHG